MLQSTQRLTRQLGIGTVLAVPLRRGEEEHPEPAEGRPERGPCRPLVRALVGVLTHEDGTVVPALDAAIKARVWGEVVAVLSFVRSTNPDRAA